MKQPNRNLKSPKKSQENKLAQAAKYSGLAFEMIFIILAGVFGGIQLDELFNTSPILTALLALFAVFVAIYLAVKDFF
jgi:F0F1-type ATP synthase assembly protein I